MTQRPPTPPPQDTRLPALVCDWEAWLPYIEDSSLSDAQKQQMIESLWAIVVAFVDLGWEIRDAPQESCGQALDLKAALAAAVINSKEQQKEEV